MMKKKLLLLLLPALALALGSCSRPASRAVETSLPAATAPQVGAEAAGTAPTDTLASALAPSDATSGTESTDNSDALLRQSVPDSVPQLLLRRTGYVTSYNPETRLPNWVAWHLTADHLDGPYARNGLKFAEDTDVPRPRADDWDYYGSGYDRGHMCPAADNKWSEQAMLESFLFTNCCPQNGNLNRGDWNEMEIACRKWAGRYGSLYIVAGPVLLRRNHKTIGEHKVVVPEAFFKVVLCLEGQPKGIAFIYRNTNGDRPKDAYVNSIRDVERITGYHFFPALDEATARNVKAQARLSDW